MKKPACASMPSAAWRTRWRRWLVSRPSAHAPEMPALHRNGARTQAGPLPRGASALLVASLALIPAAARAECVPGAADVSWVRLEGAESCPTAARIRAEVARRLETTIGGPGEGRSIDVVVQGGPGSWTAKIRTRGCGAPEAVREIASKSLTCEAITNAATLVIALAIDPVAALRAPRGADAPPASARAADAPTPAAPAASSALTAPAMAPAAAPWQPAPARPPLDRVPAISPPAAPHVETTVSVRGLATAGLLPAVGLGLAWSAEWTVTPLLTLTTGLAWLPERRTADPTYGFGMTAGWVGACAEVLRLRSVVLGPCGRLLAGTIDAVLYTNPAVTPTAPGGRAWGGLGAGLRLAVRVVGPLRAEAGVDLLAPLTRHAFALANPTRPIFQQPPVTGALSLGAGVSF